MLLSKNQIKIVVFLTALGGLFGLILNNRPALADNTAKPFSEKVPVLMYHYISAAPATTTLPGLYLDPKIFSNQLAELKKDGYKTIFVSDLAISLRAEEKLADKPIVLTFDDGYEDFYTQAYPILKEYGFKATLYVIINRLDTPGYLTKEQVKELASGGMVEIGSHTFNHPDLRTLKNRAAGFEIKDSRAALSKISGASILTFAYPFGYQTPADWAMVSSADYLGAVGTQPGVCQSMSDIWLIKRLRPDNRQGPVFSKWLADWLK